LRLRIIFVRWQVAAHDIIGESCDCHFYQGLLGSGVAHFSFKFPILNKFENDNDSPGTANHSSVDYNEFTDETRDLHGRDAELLDAFIYGRGDLFSKRASFRLGHHAMLYGESLFWRQWYRRNPGVGGYCKTAIKSECPVPRNH
jgi:hypothetical protein